MSRELQRKKALADRRQRIVEHIVAGRTVAEIATREGVDTDYAKRQRKEIAKEEGLTIWEPKLPPKKDRKGVEPYGITKSSARFRVRLGTIVSKHKEKIHPVELAQLTGVTQTGLTETHSNPSTHDWTISQLERLAALEGKDFVSLMKDLLRDATF